MNWNAVSKFLGDGARPYAIVVCATAIAICCFIPATADLAIPTAGAVVLGHGYFRTMDKKNSSVVASAEGLTLTGDASVKSTGDQQK